MTRISAYLLAGDPYWADVSVRAYYHLVDRIVVSYDERNLGWSGRPLEVRETIARVRSVDPDGKVVLLPGRWDGAGLHPMEMETRQRQAALDAASEGADWVVQLDGDEIVTDPARFARAVSYADAQGLDAMSYPQRWVYAQVARTLFLARSRRWWGPLATYEAPQAVRAGARLKWGRMTEGPALHVAYARFPRGSEVHVRPSQAIAHLSWVRPEEVLRRKASWSGHSNDVGYQWNEDIEKWVYRRRHPVRTVALTPLRRNTAARLAFARIPLG